MFAGLASSKISSSVFWYRRLVPSRNLVKFFSVFQLFHIIRHVPFTAAALFARRLSKKKWGVVVVVVVGGGHWRV